MKKTMIGLLALVSLGLTGCGGGDEKADTSKSAEKETTAFTGEYIVDAEYVKKKSG